MARRSFGKLLELVARLRSEEGCPWDRAQNHRTLRPYLLEEAHEVINAIDAEDAEALVDELGDLLLQVLLHAQIASEEGHFTIADVINRLAEKLIRRHPHVFAGAPKEMDAICCAWERMKANEGRRTYSLPILLAARKLAARLGDERAFAGADYPSLEAEEGGEILAAIASAWRKGIDPELALWKTMAHLAESARKTT